MKIVGLRIENFKRVKLVEIAPVGPVVKITGENDNGKTSCLDAIAALFGGERLSPTVPIRRGERHAEVTADLQDMVATRRWSKLGGSTLILKGKDGAPLNTPQRRLDAAIGKLSYDPLAFSRASPAEQVEILRKLVGLDFAAADAERQRLYEERTNANRDVTALKGAIARMPEVAAPDEEVSIAGLLAEQQDLLAQQRQIQEAQRQEQLAAEEIPRVINRRDEALNEVSRLERALSEAKIALAGWEKSVTEAQAKADAAAARFLELDHPVDLDGIRRQLAEAEGTNAKVRAKKARASEMAKLAEKEKAALALTRRIDKIDDDKARALAEAKFPIEGLGFGDGCVTLDGLPFDQGGGAKKLRAALAIGIALNKDRDLHVMLIDEAEVLDKKSMAIVEEMAAASGTQLWLTMVGEGGQGDIVISDGEVVGAPVSEARP